MYASSTIAVATLLLFIALAGGALYLFGLPRDLKRHLEVRVAENMGENSAAELVKEGIRRLPEDNRLNTNESTADSKDGIE